MSPPRLRFCPSPTGLFHVGGARTALYNWLVARRHGGTFILRIEDTDVERSREEWVDGIYSALNWFGVDWDEGPFRQSERAGLYAEGVQKLLAGGRGYWCDCTRDQIEARTHVAASGYDGFCRDRGLEAGPGRAVRFRTPDEGVTEVVDLIRGRPAFDNATIEDFVVQRSNGTAVFILANVVDDVDMAVSHVVRGEEHLPNTPKALLLWDALGAGPPPVFAHLPVLVNERRQKLSKRRDKVALEDYRDQGYLPEAMRNYLALLGWGPGEDREFMTTEELVERFALEDVNPSPAFFDERKLAHFNGHYIRQLPAPTFVRLTLPWLTTDPPWPPERFDLATFERMAPLVQERVQTLADVPSWVGFVFLDDPVLDEPSWTRRVVDGPHAGEVLAGAERAYAECAWEADAIRLATVAVGEALGLGLTKTQFPIRVAVTGRDVGPPLFEALVVLGRERTLARIEAARRRLELPPTLA